MSITLLRTNADHPDFTQLVKILDQGLKITDGDDHDFYDQFNQLDTIKEVVIAYEGEQALGCGAFKPYDETTIEIKRMFVKENTRGKGIATLVLRELETWGKELNYHHAILETGIKQVAAVHLYQKNAYQIIPNYGQYIGLELSVCMRKTF